MGVAVRWCWYDTLDDSELDVLHIPIENNMECRKNNMKYYLPLIEQKSFIIKHIPAITIKPTAAPKMAKKSILALEMND